MAISQVEEGAKDEDWYGSAEGERPAEGAAAPAAGRRGPSATSPAKAPQAYVFSNFFSNFWLIFGKR